MKVVNRVQTALKLSTVRGWLASANVHRQLFCTLMHAVGSVEFPLEPTWIRSIDHDISAASWLGSLQVHRTSCRWSPSHHHSNKPNCICTIPFLIIMTLLFNQIALRMYVRICAWDKRYHRHEEKTALHHSQYEEQLEWLRSSNYEIESWPFNVHMNYFMCMHPCYTCTRARANLMCINNSSSALICAFSQYGFRHDHIVGVTNTDLYNNQYPPCWLDSLICIP